jgi:hypothetical protein
MMRIIGYTIEVTMSRCYSTNFWGSRGKSITLHFKKLTPIKFGVFYFYTETNKTRKENNFVVLKKLFYIWVLFHLNQFKMNKEKVLGVVNDIILDRVTQLIEDMSNHDFIEVVMDRLEEEGVEFDSENEDVVEEIRDIVGERVLPLLFKMSEYLIGKNIPID